MDGVRQSDKRREADGDRPWREADRRRIPDYDSGREHDARRRRDSSERQQTDRAASSSHAAQSARPSSPRFPQVKQLIGRVRVVSSPAHGLNEKFETQQTWS